MQAGILDIATVLICLAAVFSVINHKILRLPYTIGLTLSGLVAAAILLLVDALVPALGVGTTLRGALALVDFPTSLMQGMLGFLLFAGAMHVDLDDLLQYRLPIAVLATAGVLISTVVIGLGSHTLFALAGTPVPRAWCLVFGALISPTDPIAVIGVMKSLGVPRSLEIKVAGESLFNDGVGVVVFSLLLAAAGGGPGHGGDIGLASVAAIFTREVVGGMVLGLAAGYLVYRIMRTLDEANTEILLSLALVMGINLLAFRFHSSAPLACVVAGLFIGNHGRRLGMSRRTSSTLDLVWSFIDESLNGVLFLLVGVEVVATFSLDGNLLLAAVLLVGLALVGRLVSVALPVAALRRFTTFSPGVVRILTWGGLKGGISIALALSLPPFPGRAGVVMATSIIVGFSVLVQGLTVGPLIRRLLGPATSTG